MIRSQTEKIPPQPVTCGCVGGGGGRGRAAGQRESESARQPLARVSRSVPQVISDLMPELRGNNQEFPTGSPVAAVETTISAIGGAII